MFNFRPDRARQLTQKLLASGFDVVTMTRYRDDFDCPVVFGVQEVENTLAEVLAENGLRQLHVAETEKYAHVTYFFNGGREEEWPGEVRILVPSPRDVPSYDHKPEMSAPEVTDRFVDAVKSDDFAFAVLNFANPDMVGHTGSIPAAIRAVETVDTCLGRVVEAVRRARRRLPRHGRSRQRRADAPARRKPSHGPHDEPRAACADRHEHFHFRRRTGRLGSCGPRAPGAR